MLKSEQSRRRLALAERAAASAAPACDTPAAVPATSGGDLFPSIPLSLDCSDDEEDKAGVATATAVGSSEDASRASPQEDSEHTSDAAAPVLEVDADGNPPYVHLGALARLFAHITSAVTRHATVWQLYATVEEANGRRSEAIECRLRCVRR